MSKSLRAKFVFILLLVIVLLIVFVLVFLIRGVQDFYKDQFYTQIESVFKQTDLIHHLRVAADEDDAVSQMFEMLRVFSGQLGIDGVTRDFYILDGTTGQVLASSSPDKKMQVDITPNILAAIRNGDLYRSNARENYLDISVPISNAKDSVGFIVYILDNKQVVLNLNAHIFSLILEALLVGFVFSIAVSLIVSKTLLSPIQGMTKAAEAMADGDFTRKIGVESGDEIGILAQTFNDMASQIESMLEELKKAENLRREFVANVSHELRTPLTSIRTYAETIYEDNDIPKDTEEEFLRVIINESDRMTKIVQDLLDLSRFDSGNRKLNIEEFSIERSVRDVYTAVALEAKKRDHVLNLELEWKMPMIKGDRPRIEQVLMNIVSNALKYTPDGGRIDIFGTSLGTNIIIRIEDTGIGIPKADLERVFDRFYRVDKARSRESGGTGLGLSIAKEIIAMHGGNISIESEPGKGTSVTVTLPISGAP